MSTWYETKKKTLSFISIKLHHFWKANLKIMFRETVKSKKLEERITPLSIMNRIQFSIYHTKCLLTKVLDDI